MGTKVRHYAYSTFFPLQVPWSDKSLVKEWHSLIVLLILKMPLHPCRIPPPFAACEAHGYPSSLVDGEMSFPFLPTAVTSSKGSESRFSAKISLFSQ